MVTIIKERESRYIPAIAKCDCGEEFPLENQYLGACECPGCGQWYNLFGQELNDPSTWSEGGDW